MIFQQTQLISGSIQLSVADILFILACSRARTGRDTKHLRSTPTISAWWGNNVGLVLEKETRHETQQLAS
jgi:hypothetical protein